MGEISEREFYFSKLDSIFRAKCLDGEITEEGLELILDELEGMLASELKAKYMYEMKRSSGGGVYHVRPTPK